MEHQVVSRADWLAARKELLAEEKEFTRRRDALSAARRELPWVKVAKTYEFEGPGGRETLADLFAEKSQLIVYHFMLGPGWEEGCMSCSYLADHFDGMLPHLAALVPFHEHQGLRVVAVSTADTPPEEAVRHMGFHELRLPLFHEIERPVELFPTDVTPSAALVDDQGRIFARYQWARPQRPTAEDIEVAIDRLMRGNPWRP